MNNDRRPLRRAVQAGDALLNLIIFFLILLLLLYAGYSIWYSRSLISGSFLPEELAMYKPTGTEPTLEDLMEINPDVRAWLTIDGTNIDYPVVQGKSDFEYLNKDVLGEFSLAGAIFLSGDNRPDFSDPYNIVYGHHVEGGAMFSDVLQFREESFFREHPTGTLWLPDRAFRIEVFACMEADAYDSQVYQPPGSVMPEGLPTLCQYIRERSVQKRDVTIQTGDSILGMSTCEDAMTYDRVVLFGKLIPLSDEEIRALEQKNLAEMEQRSEGKDKKGILAILEGKPVWILAALIMLIVLMILWFHGRNRR